jgi:hypothetical protein
MSGPLDHTMPPHSSLDQADSELKGGFTKKWGATLKGASLF